MKLESALKNCRLFSGLDSDSLQRVASLGRLKRFRKGELIFSEGEPATGFYVVVSGKVKIYKLSRDGREQILHVVGQGETFAEAALFSGESYPAFAEGLTDCQTVFLGKEGFFDLIRRDPQLAMNIIATLSTLLRRFNKMIEELSLKEISARLAKYLLDELLKSGVPSATGVEIHLDVTKSQLAAALGTVSETLSRTLKKLKEREIIDVSGKCITILNDQALREISAGLKV